MPQSHQREGSTTLYSCLGRPSLWSIVSFTMKLWLCRSNHITIWVLALALSALMYFMQLSLHSCPDCNTAFHISPLLANNEAILKYVDFTKAMIGRFHMSLSTSFIDSIIFVVICPHIWPLSYDLVHFSTGILSIYLPASGFDKWISLR